MEKIKFENLESKYEIVIIGAGPAGLSFVNNLKNVDAQDILLVDTGLYCEKRNRYSSNEVTIGYGGAGLFSDGKFSFHPSASKLWKLKNEEFLAYSYIRTKKILENFYMEVPDFPDIEEETEVIGNKENNWIIKDYPSKFLSLNKRIDLINYLTDEGKGCCIEGISLEKFKYNHTYELFNLEFKSESSNELVNIESKMLIIASGRFGSLLLNDNPQILKKFYRFEYGVRIQQPSNEAFFYSLDQVDPKFKFRYEDNKIEWRTFCACRDGETILSNTQDNWTVSGRTDCEATGYSNIGFNTRILDEKLAQKLWNNFKKNIQNKEAYFEILLDDFFNNNNNILEKMENIYCEEMVRYLYEGLKKLQNEFPNINNKNSVLIGPTLEGVCYYPVLNDNLKVNGHPIWVIGDATGQFRGITAAMVSGFYAASCCKLFLKQKKVLIN